LIFYEILLGGERDEIGHKDRAKHASSRKNSIEEGQGGLYGEVDVIVLPEQPETGGRDDGEAVARVESRQADDEAVEEGPVLVFEGYFVADIDFVLSILLPDNLYHS